MSDRLFVPLNSEPYRNFESGHKDIELRGINPQFNPETVTKGRCVELRRGYSTGDSLWGTIADVWTYDSLEAVADTLDHTRIDPGATREEFLQTAHELVGDYEAFIAFRVDLDEPPTRDCPLCEQPMDASDAGYVYFWECDRDDCPNADGYWRIYDFDIFGRVKEVQRAVGQGAAERLAAEFKDGVLA